MRLQTAKHRVVRFFRALLTLVMFGLIGFLSWNFAIQPHLPIPESRRARDFTSGLSAFTEGFTFQHTEGNRTFFKLTAATHESFQNAPNVFRGVEVMIYGNETDPDRRISSEECTYDPETGDIEFRGKVVAQLDEQTTGRSEALSYKNKTRQASTRSRVSVERPNEMAAEANSMEFGVESGVLRLAGKVHATLASGAELDSDAAVFHRQESWTTVTGHVFVRSKTGWARGDDARAELEPASFKPKAIAIRGNVTAETRSAQNDDVWQLTRADRLDLVMSPSGAVERAAAIGQARLEKRSTSGRRILTGGELVAWVDAHGNVERVEATQAARLEAGDGTRVTILDSNKIRLDPSGTIVTEGPSVMDSSDSTIKGRDFNIVQGDVISTFTTFFPATVDTRRPGAPSRHMKAERSTTAQIDGKTNQLIDLVSIGSVQFTDGDRRGNADKATVTNGGDNILLEGSATVDDPKTRIDGKRIEIMEKGATFKASGAVQTVSKSDTDPVTITADEAHGRSGGESEKVFYKGNVKTIAQSSSGPLKIWAAAAEGNSASMLYTGNVDTVVVSEGGPVRITARQAEGNADRMKYTGTAQLWRELDNVEIQSERLDIWPKEKRFSGENGSCPPNDSAKCVHFRMREMEGTSATLDYDDARGTASYSGNVRLRQKDKDMTIAASQVDAKLVEGRISDAIAKGAVTVTQGAARGTGDQAVYQVKDEKVTLTGHPATVNDPTKGNTQGATVTMERSGKNATVTGPGEGAPRGQVTSKTRVNP